MKTFLEIAGIALVLFIIFVFSSDPTPVHHDYSLEDLHDAQANEANAKADYWRSRQQQEEISALRKQMGEE